MVQFAVIQKDAQWAVLKDGEVIEHELSRSQAIRIGEQLAFENEATTEVELVVQDYTGELRNRYSGDEDATP
jgi:hypothetical protein